MRIDKSKRIKVWIPFALVVSCFVGLMVATTFISANNPIGETKTQPIFATWNGLGPDKWASIWLIQRHINPLERVRLLPEGSESSEMVLFDIPNSLFFRTTEVSTFEQIARAYSLDNADVTWLTRVVHDIDINMWMPDQESFSSIAERSYRNLQTQYGRDRVPYHCYMQFFDNVASTATLSAAQRENVVEEDLLPPASCSGGLLLSQNEDLGQSVHQMPIPELFDVMRTGANVVFVDVREPAEFKESHVPGAINLQIRNLDSQSIEALKRADLVVTYCVKDFRGFEMAKKLQDAGVANAVILKPYGIKGWIEAGLPVSQSDISDNDVSAKNQLFSCVNRQPSCKAIL